MSSFVRALGFSCRQDAIDHHNSRPAYLLKRSEQALNAMYLERCRDGGLRLTLSQLLLLSAIDSVSDTHQALAARLTGMDTPTTAVVIRGLADRRLVERKSSAVDRRQRIVSATDAGRDINQSGLEKLAAARADFFEPAAPADQDRLLHLLLRISENPKANPPVLCNTAGEATAEPHFLPPAVLPAFLIGRCLQVAVSLAAPAVAPFGFSIGQYVALFVVATLEECNLLTLSQALGTERSSLSLILPALEARSLVTVRRPGTQPGSPRISPTQQGLDLLSAARPAAEAANERIFAGLQQRDAEEFTRILQHILRCHGKLMNDQKPATPASDVP